MQRKNILLVRTFRPAENQHITPPLGIMSLKSYLEAHRDAYQVHLLDMVLDELSARHTAARIRSLAPDVVGFSAFTHEFSIVEDILQEMGRHRPKTVLGGPHANVMPRDTLAACPGLDYIISGEGEPSFAQLLDRIFAFSEQTLDTIDGLCFRRNGRVYCNGKKAYIADPGTLPMPAWNAIDLERYNNHHFRNMNWIKLRKYAPLFTSRACPYHCIYCHRVFGKGFRPLSAERVVQEMVFLHNRFHVSEFHILDDVFNLDRERVHKIARYIIDEGMDVKLAFPNGLRADLLDEETLRLLRQAGAYRMVYAVESGSARMQTLLKKHVKLAKVQEIIRFTHTLGVLQSGFFMIGFPEETLDEIQQTIRFALDSKLDTCSIFQVVPFPGTELYDWARQVNPRFTYSPQDHLYYSATSYYQQTYGVDLKKIQQQAYRKFYLNPRRVLNILRHLPDKRYLLQGAKYFLSYSSRLFRRS